MTIEQQKASDHDLLVELNVHVAKIDRCMTNHLHHHERTEDWHRRLVIAAFGAALAALVTGIASLVAWAMSR